ncbi:hypothetical protein [Streptomyces griseosporeus]|uniref:hypothetical protein n=1 Tax=Streptomyces griseosporeus TaxID=1910 RepID=UPI0036CB7963
MSLEPPPGPGPLGPAIGAPLAVDDEISHRLRACGLEVFHSLSAKAPSVAEVFRHVVHIDATPVQRIPVNSSGAGDSLNKAWKSHALRAKVIADDGSFLMAGGLNHGWVHVRMTEATDITSLEGQGGDLLFIARSFDGHHVCAASREEGEYWILETDFPFPDPGEACL